MFFQNGNPEEKMYTIMVDKEHYFEAFEKLVFAGYTKLICNAKTWTISVIGMIEPCAIVDEVSKLRDSETKEIIPFVYRYL